jgi:eukaryotic-like serine/threonine-protein kinase
MPVEAPDRVGSVIDGRYKITEVMASGAMGAVYKAERVPVGKLVAVKFLHQSFAHDSEFQARFERETRVMAKLDHPNCVSVLDFGVWENSPYLVMDFVDGVTLRSRLDKQKRIPPIEALQITRQILSGLAHAHKQNVFHRDVKPANIMISQEIGHGELVRILDFGLARLQGNVGRDATQTNMVVGTPNYMAPEQTVPGTTVDERTDLYAVGVVLYEMVVGDRPFQAEETLQLLGMHRAAPIPRLADRVKEGVELPNGLQEVIDKAMAKAPADRYQTAIEMAQAISDVIARKDSTDIDVTLPKMQPGPVSKKMKTAPAPVVRNSSIGTASTVASLEQSAIEREAAQEAPRKSSFGRTLFMLMLLVAGSAAMAGYYIRKKDRAASTNKVVETTRDAAAVGSGSAVAMATLDAAPQIPTVEMDAATPVATVELDAGVIDMSDASIDLINDAGVSEEEIQIDPANVEDPDTASGSAAPPDDEEKDAPQTPEEVEKREPEPPAPQLATSVHDAVLLIKAGKKDLALASLHKLYKKQPNSGYIPFLLGNLYFDKKWWSVSMQYYRTAIKKNSGYRSNAVLNRNIIRMLASNKTRGAATNFLRGVIGHPAAYHLKYASTHETNPVVRARAKELSRYIR